MKRLFVILGLLLSATVVYAQSNGFAPNGNYTAAWSVTTVSSTKTLPTGAMVVVYNTGTVNAYCALGNSSVTATTNNDVIYPNGFMGFTRYNNSTIACLTSTSGTTLNISGGAGIAAGAVGGSSSGGGGGSVTQGTTPWVVSGQGTAGTAATGVVTIQGIASGTPVAVTQSAAANNTIGITPTDRTITSASGSSQQIAAANASRHGLIIQNIGTSNCGVNPTGGTAAIGGAGTLTLVPQGSYQPRIPTLSAVTVICTAAQPIYAEEN